MRVLFFFLGGLIALLPATAMAEFQISIYGGGNTASDGDVTLKQGALSGTYGVEWFGESFEPPPYYGVRGTYWFSGIEMPQLGVAIDVTHAKVSADKSAAPLSGTFSTLEFTNGLNTATLNALYRVRLSERFTAYAGVGAGVAFPHAEVETSPSVGRTFEYQLTGPAVQAMIGVSFEVWNRVSVFGEYKANYSWNEVDLVGGGTLEADVLMHQFAAGISYAFGGP